MTVEAAAARHFPEPPRAFVKRGAGNFSKK
jgi:hypothetical protein